MRGSPPTTSPNKKIATVKKQQTTAFPVPKKNFPIISSQLNNWCHSVAKWPCVATFLLHHRCKWLHPGGPPLSRCFFGRFWWVKMTFRWQVIAYKIREMETFTNVTWKKGTSNWHMTSFTGFFSKKDLKKSPNLTKPPKVVVNKQGCGCFPCFWSDFFFELTNITCVIPQHAPTSCGGVSIVIATSGVSWDKDKATSILGWVFLGSGRLGWWKKYLVDQLRYK